MVVSEPYGEADYIADNYGRCTLATCICLLPRNPWLGRGCACWIPVTAKTFEEMRRAHG